MNEVARRLEAAAGVQFERDVEGEPVVRKYTTVRNGQRVEGWYFRFDNAYKHLTDDQENVFASTFPMNVNGVEYRYGNVADRDWDEDRHWAASVAFYIK